MRPLPAPALILVAAGLLAGCPKAEDGGAGQPGEAAGPDPAVAAALAKRPDLAKDRVHLLGLDGCDPVLVRRLVAAGRLPHFQRLMDEGAFGPLRSQQPMLSPLLWTTIATGKWPTEHGVLDFMVRSRTDPAAREAVTSRNRQVEAIWDIAGRYGRTVGVVGWLASHPAEKVNGFAVSERTELLAYLFNEGILPTDEGKTWPPGLIGEIAPLRRRPADVTWAEGKEFLHVTEEEWRAACTEDRFTAGNRTNNLRLILTAADNFRRVGAHLLRDRKPALFCSYFEMLDAVGHNFMAYQEPITWVPRPLEEVQAFYRGNGEPDPKVVEKAWRWARGEGPREGLEKELKPEQLATIAELARGADPASVARWKDAVDAAYVWTDRLLGEAMDACDADTTLLVVSDHGFASGPGKPPVDSSFQSRIGGASFHMMDGVLGAWGKGVRKGFAIPPYEKDRPGTGARLLDIAPTVLALMGFPQAKDMPGRVLSEMFDLDLVVGGVDTYETGRSARLAKERVEEESRRPRTGKEPEDQGEDSPDEAMKQIMAVGYVGTAEEGPFRPFLHMAASYQEQGRLPEAEEALGEALKLMKEPGLRTGTLVSIGMLRSRQGDPGGARRRYAEALQENPDYIPAIAGICLLDQEAGDYGAAIAGWERVVALQPSSGDKRIRLATALRLRSEANPDSGAKDLRRAVDLVREFTAAGKGDPHAPDTVSPEGHNDIGMILLRASDFPGAIEEFRKAAAKPGYRSPRSNLGVLYLNLANRFLTELQAERDPGRRKGLEASVAANRAEALRWLGEVIEREPDYAKALYNRAEVNFYIPPRDLAAAERDLVAAIRADPKYARAAALLDKVRQAAGGR